MTKRTGGRQAKKTDRFRFSPFYVILAAASCIISVFYWWSCLTPGADLFSYNDLTVRLQKPFGYEVGRSKSDDEELMRRGGSELRSRIEVRLREEGFANRSSREGDVLTGRYRGSPKIEVRLRDRVSADEMGVFYEISANYSCKLPRSTSRFQSEMTKLIEEFDHDLNSWLDGCRNELLADRPEYR